MLVLASDRPSSSLCIHLFISGLVHCTALLSKDGHFEVATSSSEWLLHSHIFVFTMNAFFRFLNMLHFFLRLTTKQKYIQINEKKCTQEHLSNALKSLPLQKMLSICPHLNHPHSRKQNKNKTLNLSKTHNILIINNYNFTIF